MSQLTIVMKEEMRRIARKALGYHGFVCARVMYDKCFF